MQRRQRVLKNWKSRAQRIDVAAVGRGSQQRPRTDSRQPCLTNEGGKGCVARRLAGVPYCRYYSRFFSAGDGSKKRGKHCCNWQQRMCALEYCRASLHLETNYGNCIINDGAFPVRFILRGGEINRNNNVTSNTANFPLFALAHTRWLALALAAGTREARRNFCLLECGPIVQKKVGGTCAHPATTSQIGGSSVSKRSQLLKSDWVTPPPSLAS